MYGRVHEIKMASLQVKIKISEHPQVAPIGIYGLMPNFSNGKMYGKIRGTLLFVLQKRQEKYFIQDRL